MSDELEDMVTDDDVADCICCRTEMVIIPPTDDDRGGGTCGHCGWVFIPPPIDIQEGDEYELLISDDPKWKAEKLTLDALIDKNTKMEKQLEGLYRHKLNPANEIQARMEHVLVAISNKFDVKPSEVNVWDTIEKVMDKLFPRNTVERIELETAWQLIIDRSLRSAIAEARMNVSGSAKKLYMPGAPENPGGLILP